MKKIVTVQEVEGEGLMALLGKKVILFCANYFYSGILEGVNTDTVLLGDAGVVFETGSFQDKKFKDFQLIGHKLYVRVQAIESFCETDKA